MEDVKVLVEFKTAKGSPIEVSEEKLKQSQLWLDKIMPNAGDYNEIDDRVDNIDMFYRDNSFGTAEYENSQDEKGEYEVETFYREVCALSNSPLTNTTPSLVDYTPPKPLILNRSSTAFKPFTPPTISNELREEMVARRSMDRKRKSPDDSNVSSTPITSTPSASALTPEQRERIRMNREAAIAKRKLSGRQ